MVAKKTPAAKTAPATEKAARKPRTPKPVNDLPSATIALKAAQRRADRADAAYKAAEDEHTAAHGALYEAKEKVREFYEALMNPAKADAPEATPEQFDAAEDDGYEASGNYGDDGQDETSAQG